MSERPLRRVLALFLLVLLVLPQLKCFCYAAPKDSFDPYLNMPNFGSITENGLTWKNSKTGFRVVIEDDIDLLTSSEERRLLEDMSPMTEYGSIAFWSTRGEASEVRTKADEKLDALFGEESASLVVINKALPQLSIQSRGSLARMIPAAKADGIVSRGKTDLSGGLYYDAASGTFSRMNAQIQSAKTASHVRVIIVLCVSLVIGLGVAAVVLLPRHGRTDPS